MTSCPADHKYFDESKKCVSSCDSGFVASVTVLQCVDKCPNKYRINEDGMKVCQDECHDNQFVDGSLCLDVHCADRADDSNKTYSANRQCVDKCDGSYPFVELSGRECVLTCGELYSNKGVCQESCAYYELIDGEKICQDSDCSNFYIQEGNTK